MASPNERLYRNAAGHAWVATHAEGDAPPNATHWAQLPEAEDGRWRPGAPAFANIEFITFVSEPDGGLKVRVEKQPENLQGNPLFEGCKAWMPVSDSKWQPLPQPERSRYVVMDEHTLGYLIPEMPYYIGILAGSILKGGPDPLQGMAHIVPGNSKVRQATEDDFEAFRVLPPACFRAA